MDYGSWVRVTEEFGEDMSEWWENIE